MLDFFVERRDCEYGSGIISPDARQFYVNIPKSASSFISSWLFSSGWTSTTAGRENINWNAVEEVIVILRNPLERWISGMSQFVKGYILESSNPEDFINNYTDLTEKFIISSLDIFDDHVWPQYCFFENVLPNAKRKFIFIDSNFEQKIKNELDLIWPVPPDVNFNKSDDDQDLKKLKKFFKIRVEENNNLRSAIENAYQKDYKIIKNNCNF